MSDLQRYHISWTLLRVQRTSCLFLSNIVRIPIRSVNYRTLLSWRYLCFTSKAEFKKLESKSDAFTIYQSFSRLIKIRPTLCLVKFKEYCCEWDTQLYKWRVTCIDPFNNFANFDQEDIRARHIKGLWFVVSPWVLILPL